MVSIGGVLSTWGSPKRGAGSDTVISACNFGHRFTHGDNTYNRMKVGGG